MKKQQVQHTTSSPVPLDFIDMSYSPALLLDGCLDASITDIPAFSDGCEHGFGAYFDAVNDFGDNVHLVSEVRRFMVELAANKMGPVFLDRRFWFHWNIGYGLGWLSALALSQYEEAMEGLNGLMALLEQD